MVKVILGGPIAASLALYCLGQSIAHTGSLEPIRVATFNLARRADLPSIAGALRGHHELRAVDVLLIQEIEAHPDRDVPRDLARALGLELLYAPARPRDGGTHGLALLSRTELHEPEIVDLPEFDLGYRSYRRVAVGATLLRDERKVRIYNVHLDTRLTFEDRLDQLAPVLRRAVDVPSAVVGGDFNTIRSHPFLLPWFPLPLPGLGQATRMDRFMQRQGFETPLADAGATGPLWMRLDAIYTRGVEVIASGKARVSGLSDHAALWIDLAVPEDGTIP